MEGKKDAIDNNSEKNTNGENKQESAMKGEDLVMEKVPIDDKKEESKPKSEKSLIYAIIGLIIVIILVFAVPKLIPEKKPVTEDQLIELNIQGKLTSDKGYMYEEVYSFVLYDGLWVTKLEKDGLTHTLRLHYGPKDLWKVSLVGSLNDSLFNDNDEYYTTFDPISSSPEMFGFIALSLGEFSIPYKRDFHKTPIAACLRNETEACQNRPIIDCNNTKKPVIYWKDSEPTELIFDDNCIIIQGTGEEIVKATDRLMYYLYGIME